MKTTHLPQSPAIRTSKASLPPSRRMPAADLTAALDPELLLRVLLAFRRGDFTVRMPTDLTGLCGKVADTLNEIIENEARLTKELIRVAQGVGKEGKMSQRANVGNAVGSWAEKLEAINTLITGLVQPTSETARIIGAVAQGDMTQTMPLEVEGRPLKGEFLRTAKVVNGMEAQLGSFSSEVTRVAREVGTDGKLGGQAVVRGVSGTWKDLTDSVNSMASNLTAEAAGSQKANPRVVTRLAPTCDHIFELTALVLYLDLSQMPLALRQTLEQSRTTDPPTRHWRARKC